MKANQILGFKYQIYEGDQLKIYRLVRHKADNTVMLISESNSKPKYVKQEDLKNKYIRLLPDAFMNIFLTDSDENPDVYVCVSKASNIMSNKFAPDSVLRQNCVNFLNITQDNLNSRLDKIPVGDTIINNDTNDSKEIVEFMRFNNIDYSASVALYIDDTIDGIISTLPNKVVDKINDQLKHIKSTMESANTMYVGYVSEFRKLLVNNYFLNNYRRLFNIVQVNWQVDLGHKSHNAEGDIILNNEQKMKFENEIRQYVTNIRVIKYDKDIDIANIVSSPHVLISDSDEIIYLIAYDIIANFPIDDDIARAMRFNK